VTERDASDDEEEYRWGDACPLVGASHLKTDLLWKLKSKCSEALAKRLPVDDGATDGSTAAQTITIAEDADPVSETQSTHADLRSWEQRFFKLEYSNGELTLTYVSANSDLQLKGIKVDSVEKAVEIPVRATDASIENKQLEIDKYLRKLAKGSKSFPALLIDEHPQIRQRTGTMYVFSVRGKVVDSAMKKNTRPSDTDGGDEKTVGSSIGPVFFGTESAETANGWVTQITNRIKASSKLHLASSKLHLAETHNRTKRSADCTRHASPREV
jgi:hypothetical protein